MVKVINPHFQGKTLQISLLTAASKRLNGRTTCFGARVQPTYITLANAF